jgi:chemotaxis protein CheY-P-specific phosphatase CheC/CheY-like chemotaxis protein
MSTPIIICDDSRMARKQLARCLPQDWDVDVHFAEDGRECIEIAKHLKAELIFLDLNMPILDGYETLEEINDIGLDSSVIVVSGDIQPDAQTRVTGLGAINFIKKPVSQETMLATLEHHGYYTASQSAAPQVLASTGADLNDESVFIDACQEVANIAMGRAGDSLARFLGEFIQLPVPKVNHIELSELAMALQFTESASTVSAVCQGFIGPSLSGEALLIFNDSSFKNIAKIMKYDEQLTEQVELELLMDTANILIGACLQGISDQLDVNLSQSHPVVLGQHVAISDLLQQNKQWQKTLSIEIAYSIENRDVHCDLLLLFTEDCLPTLKQRLGYLV